MPEVIVRKGEPVDRALKRLKNKLDAEGILEEVRRLRAFETPSQKHRRNAKPKPTPSAVEPSSDLIHKVKKLKYYKVKGCLGKAVSDGQFNFLPFKLLTFRSSLPGKEVANCFYQTVNVVRFCFDF